MFNSFFIKLWALLPDKCERANCSRRGIRGNENVIDGVVTCDDCHAKF